MYVKRMEAIVAHKVKKSHFHPTCYSAPLIGNCHANEAKMTSTYWLLSCLGRNIEEISQQAGTP